MSRPPGRAARRALVTGAAGFAGQWLCRDLVQHGWLVTGCSPEGDPGPGILSVEDHATVTWRRADLRDEAALQASLDVAIPDVIFHLAGVAYIPAAGLDPMQAFDVNVGIAVRLLHELAQRRAAGTLDPSVLVIGSGEQYGRHEALAMPLGEEAECRPCSLYAGTKMAQEIFALESFRSAGVKVICTRSFNHSGRGQAPQFLLPSLVARALRVKSGRVPRLEIGNVDSVRDFLHVEDAVRAYVLLAEQGLAGEVYNVCSGEGVRVGELAADVLRAVGVAAELAPIATLRRRSDTPFLVGLNQKLGAATGWVPRRARADIINELINATSR